MNVRVATLLIGQLDLPRLKDAVQHLTDIHDVLRMRLSDAGESPSLIVAESAAAPLVFIDISAGPGESAGGACLSQTVISALPGQTFDLVAGPPWSCAIVRLASDRHIVCLVLHHLLSDSTSAMKLLGQLGTLYSGRDITPRPASYAQFSARSYPADAGRFWVSESDAAGYRAVEIDAPAGTSGPRTVAWRFHEVEFDGDMPTIVKGAMQGYRCTPYMLHAAAYCAALAQVFGRSSFVAATAVYRGDLAPTPTSVGCYLDIAYFLYRDTPEANLNELTRGVRRAFLGGLRNLSLKRSIIADIKFAGDISKVPPGTFFYDVWIGGAAVPDPDPDFQTAGFSGLTAKPVRYPSDPGARIITTPYQIWLYSNKLMPGLYLNTADGSSVSIKANMSVHTNDLVQRIASAYRNMILAMDDPHTLVRDIRERMKDQW